MGLFNHLSVSAVAVLAASMLLWAFIILTAQQQRALVAAAAVEATELRWPAESIPKNCELGDESRMGKETEQVEPLGRLVKLGTLFDPVAVEALNTKFTIHTRAGPSELMSFIANGFVFSDLSSERFHFNLTRMAISGFDARRPRTVILISGFMTGDTVNWMERVKDQWLALEDCNVIVVTWKDGNRLPYEKAAATTPRVARQIAIFLHYLFAMQAAESGLCGTSSGTVCGELCSRLHFIGHSLGAHIGGFLGQDFRGQLGRITALDPAGPSFDQFGAEQRLDRGDARLVEAIHTSSGRMKFSSLFVGGTKRVLEQMLAPLFKRTESSRSISEQFSGEGNHIWFGIDMPVGHIDYHANNGKTQPGCEDHAHICDHGRSHHIYEGFLKHELALRQLYANAHDQDGLQQEHQDEAAAFASWRQDKRLLAVNAVDYSAFASGAALNQRCPALLHERNRLSGLAEQQISHCTLPIDQVTHVDEFIGELERNYAVSFAPDEPSNQRYYFKTLSTKPFVGDHYLLRVKLERSTLWDKSCALQAVIEYADEKNTTIELDKELQMFSNGKFFGLMLPFINPNNASARFSLDVMLTKNEELQNQLTNSSSGLVLDKSVNEIDEDDEQLIRLILPLSVTLTVVENKSSQSSFSGWIKGQSPGPKCILYIDSVQVHPLASFRRGLFGVYSSRRLSGGSLRTSATMLSHLEYKRRKQAEPVWPDTLTPNTKQNHERRLQTIVVR